MPLPVVSDRSGSPAGPSLRLPVLPSFHAIAKPIGPICNLDCSYCYYLEKESLYPAGSRWRMNDEVLEAYVRQYIEGQAAPEISFVWQGGEPMLLGLDFFRKVTELQKRYAGGKTIYNDLQTNGTLLDEPWADFLAENNVLVGLSLDGPREIHDRYRLDKRQQGTFDAVMRGLELLRQRKVQFNTLSVVTRESQHKPLEIYRFLKQAGAQVMQFIPVVERSAGPMAGLAGLDFAEPPRAMCGAGERVGGDEASPVTPWSVDALAYGQFLSAIFDEWVRNDVGHTYVQIFEVMLGIWAGRPSTLCVFSETCGNAPAVEHNGDVYSCDHYVYPRYRLGNLASDHLGDLMSDARQRRFGADKADTLPAYCRACDVRFACNGECPRHRFIYTPDGEAGLNYLCAGYKHFLHHIDPHLRVMLALLQRGEPPARIMQLLREHEAMQD